MIRGLFYVFGLALGCAGAVEKPLTEVAISVSWPGAEALQVETDVLTPLEARISGVPGVERLDGRADAGLATLHVWVGGDDLQPLRDELGFSAPYLPSDAAAPVLSRAGGRTHWLSVDAANAERVARDLERIPGILQVSVRGDRPRDVSIRLDLDRLTVYGITTSAVIDGARACLADAVVGPTVRFAGDLDVSALTRCPVAMIGGAPAYLGDVAMVEAGVAAPTSFGPQGSAAILEVLTDLPHVHDPDATPLGTPMRARPTDLAQLHAAFPAATGLLDGDDVLLWGDMSNVPPGFLVFVPAAATHEVVVTAPDLAVLDALVAAIRTEVGKNGGSSWVDVPMGRPEIRLTIDRERAADHGIPSSRISDATQLALGGVVLGHDRGAPIRLEVAPPADFSAIRVASASGESIPLSQVVTVTEVSSMSILHRDRQRAAVLQITGELPDLSGIPIPEGAAIATRDLR